VTHLTVHELAAAGLTGAGAGLVLEGARPVFCCENPQVMQAAARAGVPGALLCLSGNPSSAGVLLLAALLTAGVEMRYHGDFDWPGVAIAGRVFASGAMPWRMGVGDYRNALAGLPSPRRLPLSGPPIATPWDEDLGRAMHALGVAVHEESLLDVLLADLS
jgi:uncharacterized protein (TIGR02679 family)